MIGPMRRVGLVLTAALLAACFAGGEAVTTFTIRNTGTGVLHITRVMTGCRLDAEVSSKEIKPGSSATLTVTLRRLLGRKGLYEPGLWIQSDGGGPMKKIQLKAFIEVAGGPAGTGK